MTKEINSTQNSADETVAVSGTRLPRSVKLEFEKALEGSLGLDTPSTFFRLCALAFLHTTTKNEKSSGRPSLKSVRTHSK